MLYDSVQDVLSQVQEVTEFLGVRLVDVNQKGIFGNTPLSVVITWGDLEAVSLLLDAGADVNAQGEHGYTALHDAVSFEQLDIVDRLKEAQASLLIRNDDGRTPLELAKLLGKDAVIGRLTS